MSRLIYHDPFARIELHRQTFQGPTSTTCSWCGQRRPSGAALFQYYHEQDSIRNRRDVMNGVFCSISCMRAYHNIS